MRLFFYRTVLCIIIFQLIGLPVLAENQNKPFMGGGSSGLGMSFRLNSGGVGGTLGSGSMSKDELSTKREMLTEPTLAGLTYQVHILGEVVYPGTYRIAASDRLSEVLLKAGGITMQGSQRNIELREQGSPTRVIDLLAFQQNGNLNDNPYMLDNDVVYVPLRKNTVQIVGAVMRPKEYELKKEKTLDDVMRLAGGVSVGAAKGRPINVVRFIDNKKDVLEVPQNHEDMVSFAIQNGDVIFVPHMITENNKFDFDLPKLPGDNIFYPSFEDRVFILGGVNSPGAYTFNPYYSLPQYLSLAGGTTKLATSKINILSPDGIRTKVTNKNKDLIVINPGDTVVVGEHRIPPEGWVTLFMSVASFGLATTATVLALTDRR